MHRLRPVVAVVALALVLVTAASAAPVAPELRSALAGLKRKTRVPILLPSILPHTRSSTGQKLNTAVAANTTSWTVSLFFGRTCGANACTVGSITAERNARPVTSFRRVTLVRRIRAYFKPLTCGASCSPPSIEWVYRRVLYRIQLSVDARGARERALLVRVANSAISGGRR